MPTQNLSSSFSTSGLTTAVVAAALLFSIGSTAAFAGAGHGNKQGHGMQGGDMHGHSGANGEPGKKSQAKRTVMIEMHDNFYKPEKVQVKKGETVRFIIANKGKLVHEFNIGTPDMHKAHQKEMMMMVEHGVLEMDKINRDKMMMKMPDGSTMEHNDPNSVLLEPGKKGEVIWKFSKDGRLEFGCNVPGHYDAGMVGRFSVE